MSSADAASRQLRAALIYARRLRWPVFPLAGKVPAIRGGRGCKDATLDERVIEHWWRKYPGANIGVAMGTPCGLWALDVDGQLGEDALLDLTRAHGPLPPTIEQLTGGGGRHLLFTLAGAGGITNRARFADHLDVRTTGGYIVVAPSVHPETGRAYAWSVDGHPTEVAAAAAPDWLIDAVKAPAATAPSPTTAVMHAWMGKALVDLSDGAGRNDTATRLIGYLLRRLDPRLARELAHAWNERRVKPPLPAATIDDLVQRLAAAELKKLEAADGGHG